MRLLIYFTTFHPFQLSKILSNTCYIIGEIINKYQVANNGVKLLNFLIVEQSHFIVEQITSDDQQVILYNLDLISQLLTCFIQYEVLIRT